MTKLFWMGKGQSTLAERDQARGEVLSIIEQLDWSSGRQVLDAVLDATRLDLQGDPLLKSLLK